MSIVLSFCLGVLFFVLASICNAIMDVCDHHYYKSIFKKMCKTQKCSYWWNQNAGWKNKYVDRDVSKGRVKWHFLGITFNKPVQICDSWHFFKALMVIFLAISTILYIPLINFHFIKNELFYFFIELIFFGFLWNLPFSLFYDKILTTKKNK